jgi:hypothetical protein
MQNSPDERQSVWDEMVFDTASKMPLQAFDLSGRLTGFLEDIYVITNIFNGGGELTSPFASFIARLGSDPG